MIKVRLFRDPNAEGGGGGAQEVSVAELGKQVQPGAEAPPEPPAGDEGDTPPEGGLHEGLNPDGTLKAGYVKRDDVIMTEQEAEKLEAGGDDDDETKPVVVDEAEALDEEGKLKEGYLQAEDGTYTTDPAYEYEAAPEDFWKEVDELTGTVLPEDFDYGEDPLGPEAIAKREEYVRKSSIDEFENYLKTSNPKAYQYLLHKQAGGTDEEFFDKATPSLPKREDFEDSIDIQSDWMKRDLLSKDVPQEIVDSTIAKYIKDNVLKDKALALYDSLHAKETDYLKELDELNRTKQKEFNGRVEQVLSDVSSTIDSKELGIVIPKQDRETFEKFVQSNIVHDGGKFYFSQEINPGSMNNMIQGLYLQFTKGDLSKIVEKKAKQKTVQRLRTRVRRDRSTENRGGGTAPKKDGYVPLGQLNKK